MKFRKKPVVIDAFQWDGRDPSDSVIPSWPDWAWGNHNIVYDGATGRLLICTMESSDFVVRANDWIIRGIKGEIYACKPDIFELTYEAVT